MAESHDEFPAASITIPGSSIFSVIGISSGVIGSSLSPTHCIPYATAAAMFNDLVDPNVDDRIGRSMFSYRDVHSPAHDNPPDSH